MLKKIIIETDDIRDVIAFNEAKELWGLLWDIFNEFEILIGEELLSHNLDNHILLKISAGITSIIQRYKKQTEIFNYNKNGTIQPEVAWRKT